MHSIARSSKASIQIDMNTDNADSAERGVFLSEEVLDHASNEQDKYLTLTTEMRLCAAQQHDHHGES